MELIEECDNCGKKEVYGHIYGFDSLCNKCSMGMDFCSICEEPFGEVYCKRCNKIVCVTCGIPVGIIRLDSVVTRDWVPEHVVTILCPACMSEYLEFVEYSRPLLTCPSCFKKEMYVVNGVFKCYNCKKIIKTVKNCCYKGK